MFKPPGGVWRWRGAARCPPVLGVPGWSRQHEAAALKYQPLGNSSFCGIGPQGARGGDAGIPRRGSRV